MAVQDMTIKSKIILSKLLINIMNKNLPTNDELIKCAEINYRKKKLRETYAELQEKYAASLIDEKTFNTEMKTYNYDLVKLELELHKVQKGLNEKDLYYKRLELLHNILNNKEDESFIRTNELYRQLIEAIKDEVIQELEEKRTILRLTLQLNVHNKQLSKEDEYKYRDQLYDTQLEINEVKKVLKIDKLEVIKTLPFDKLVNDTGYNLLNNLYQQEIYGAEVK